MDIQELIKTIDNLQSNASAGLLVIFYYLIVYWPKIKDGLGLSLHRQINLDKIEKNYQLLKLRIELEKVKKDSGLDEQLLDQLEHEMQLRIESKKNLPFSGSQKFIAIPLIIIILFASYSELEVLNKESINSATEILFSTFLLLTYLIIAFWGIPILKDQPKSKLRHIGFIIFWTFSFYFMIYIAMYILIVGMLGYEYIKDDALLWFLLISFIVSLFLGFLNRLPFMKKI